MSRNPTDVTKRPTKTGTRGPIRWVMIPPTTAAAPIATVIRRSWSPPAIGVIPNTVAAIKGTVTMPIINTAPTRKWVTFAKLNDTR